MFRQLHTIMSQQIIKPSSPTPPHFKTHNLSLIDQISPNIHMPLVFFYRNFNKNDTKNLKHSLSQCLTQYYPFAGRLLTPQTTYVDCNDEGDEFLESSIDGQLEDFIHVKVPDETLDQLFPNGLGCTVHNTSPNMVGVQLNHFACGGAAVAVSISHKLADACTMCNFVNHWATVARGGSPINPSFISSPTRTNIKVPELPLNAMSNYVRRRFVFTNSKLNELKNNVIGMHAAPMNLTRVEVLTSFLFKSMVGVASTRPGSLNRYNLLQTVNMRNKMVKNYPETAAGNIFSMVMTKTLDSSEIKVTEVIAELRKERMELEGLRDVQELGEKLANLFLMLAGDQSRAYFSTGMCWFPFYKVDFGWGNPVKVKIRFPYMAIDGFVLMDTRFGDGIEASVNLPQEEMAFFEKDRELLAFIVDKV